MRKHIDQLIARYVALYERKYGVKPFDTMFTDDKGINIERDRTSVANPENNITPFTVEFLCSLSSGIEYMITRINELLA